MIRLAVEQEGDPRSCEPAIPLPGLWSRKAPAAVPARYLPSLCRRAEPRAWGPELALTGGAGRLV